MSTLLEKLIGSAALKDSICKCLRIKLKPGSVTTSKIADKAVTPAKLSDSVLTEVIQPSINTAKEELGGAISTIGGALETHTSNTTKHITSSERNTWNNKQDALTFDNTPTAGSDNPVKSKGIKGYIDAAIEALHSLFSTKRIVFYPYTSEDDAEAGYIEGYTEYSAGSGLKKGVRIKGYSDYNQGRSEISLTEYGSGSSLTYAKIDAGYLDIYAGEMSTISLTDPIITFDGNSATVNTNGISIVGSGTNADAPIEIKQTTGGEVAIVSTEGNVLVQANTQATISASDVRVESENTGVVGSGEVTIFSGNGTTSPVTPGNISIEALAGPVAITGNPVTINGKDAGTYSQKMEIEELDTSLNPTMAEVGHYYTFDNVVNTLSVALTEDSTDTTHVQKILFFMTMGTSPDVTFSAAYGYHIYYDTDYELKTGSTYEVEALFNGTAWVIKSKEVYEPLFAGEFD